MANPVLNFCYNLGMGRRGKSRKHKKQKERDNYATLANLYDRHPNSDDDSTASSTSTPVERVSFFRKLFRRFKTKKADPLSDNTTTEITEVKSESITRANEKDGLRYRKRQSTSAERVKPAVDMPRKTVSTQKPKQKTLDEILQEKEKKIFGILENCEDPWVNEEFNPLKAALTPEQDFIMDEVPTFWCVNVKTGMIKKFKLSQILGIPMIYEKAVEKDEDEQTASADGSLSDFDMDMKYSSDQEQSHGKNAKVLFKPEKDKDTTYKLTFSIGQNRAREPLRDNVITKQPVPKKESLPTKVMLWDDYETAKYNRYLTKWMFGEAKPMSPVLKKKPQFTRVIVTEDDIKAFKKEKKKNPKGELDPLNAALQIAYTFINKRTEDRLKTLGIIPRNPTFIATILMKFKKPKEDPNCRKPRLFLVDSVDGKRFVVICFPPEFEV